MDRKKAADIIRKRIEIDQATLTGEPVSDFDRFVAEQDEALTVAYMALQHPLWCFIEEEVSFRLRDVLDIPEEEITPEVEKACVEYLKDHSEVMFNYDGIDETLQTIVNDMEGADDDN